MLCRLCLRAFVVLGADEEVRPAAAAAPQVRARLESSTPCRRSRTGSDWIVRR